MNADNAITLAAALRAFLDAGNSRTDMMTIVLHEYMHSVYRRQWTMDAACDHVIKNAFPLGAAVREYADLDTEELYMRLADPNR
jgi:hypothetical protein